VVLRNGTATPGITNRFESEVLQPAVPRANVVTRDNAAQTTQADTIVVDLTGSKQAEAERLAGLVSATVATLPEGESAPTGADFLILIGNNQAF
jgi:hypothetical protein